MNKRIVGGIVAREMSETMEHVALDDYYETRGSDDTARQTSKPRPAEPTPDLGPLYQMVTHG